MLMRVFMAQVETRLILEPKPAMGYNHFSRV